MVKRRNLLILVALVFASSLIVVYVNLPEIIGKIARAKLAEAGASSVELEFSRTGTQELRIDRLSFTIEHAASIYRVSADDVTARYTLAGLLSGKVDSIAVPAVLLAVNRKGVGNETERQSAFTNIISPTDFPAHFPLRLLTVNTLEIDYHDVNRQLRLKTPLQVHNESGNMSISIDLQVNDQALRHVALNISDSGSALFTLVEQVSGEESQPYLVVKSDTLSMRQGNLQGILTVDADLDAVSRELVLLGQSLPVMVSGKYNGGGVFMLPLADPGSLSWKPRGELKARITNIKGIARNISIDMPMSLALSRNKLLIEPGKGSKVSLHDYRAGSTRIGQVDVALDSSANCNIEFDSLAWQCLGFSAQVDAPVIRQNIHRANIPVSRFQLISASGNAKQGKAEFELDVPGLQVTTGKQGNEKSIKLGKLFGRFIANNENIQGKLSVQLVGGRGKSQFDIEHSLTNNNGHMSYNLQPVDMSEYAGIFAETYSGWPGKLLLNGGRVSAKGELKWRKGKVENKKHSQLQLDNISGQFGDVLFEGLTSVFEIAGIDAPVVTTQGLLRLAKLSAGTPLTAIAMQGAAVFPASGKPVINVSSLDMQALGGRVNAEKIDIDMARERNPFTLTVTGLNVEELLKLEQQQGVYGSGLVDGSLPLVLTPAGLTMEAGKLAARKPGGKLVYRPDQGVKGMAESNTGLNILLKAMENFNYAVLEADAFYRADGLLNLNVHLQGSNPELERGRPVHLNIAVEDNILQLLRSLRLADEISEKIGDQVRGKKLRQ